jgi:ABC-type ATPase with predicted acetyltransferase domain
MPLWKCNGCGFEAKGNCRPKECPECGAPKDNFLKAEESKKATPPKKSATKAAVKAKNEGAKIVAVKPQKPAIKVAPKPAFKVAPKPVKKKTK